MRSITITSSPAIKRLAYTAVLSGALAFSLAGCGNSADEKDSSTKHVAPAPATHSPEAQYDTSWEDGKVTIAKDAEAKYGREAALAAAAVPQTLVRENAFDSDLILGTREASRTRLLALASQMTPDARKDWIPAVKKFTSEASDIATVTKVFSQALVAIHPSGAKLDGRPVKTPASGPGAVNQKILSTKVTLLSDGRLLVDVKSSADLRVRKGGTPVLWAFTRKSTYYMDKLASGWKIDGWKSNYRGGDSRPE